MVKKIFLLLAIFLLIFFVPVIAQTETDLQNQINEYTQKLNELSKSKNTLSNQIKIIDTQIAQTQLKIKQTSNTIGVLKKDIANLGVKIGELDISLNELSAIYIHEINQNYKLPKRIPLLSLITSGSFNNFFENYKYLSIIQKNSQENLLNLETTRTNLDLQKQAKAEKQKELEAMEKKLATEQKSLATQKASKNDLLQITKNDEKIYQQRLADAERQLASLRTFSSNAGGSSCIAPNQPTGSDGNFYSQRDGLWCSQIINSSSDRSDTIGRIGCAISSYAIILAKKDQRISPSAIAADSSNFDTISKVLINKLRNNYQKYSSSTVDSELNAGHYVIAELSAFGGTHFVVIIGGSNGNYKIHDPWYGPDQNLNDNYSTSRIISIRIMW